MGFEGMGECPIVGVTLGNILLNFKCGNKVTPSGGGKKSKYRQKRLEIMKMLKCLIDRIKIEYYRERERERKNKSKMIFKWKNSQFDHHRHENDEIT